eukprot:4917498-Pyramimonas_sp.AAC.1
MRLPVDQNTQNIQGCSPNDAQEHPTNTANTRVPSPKNNLDLTPQSDCTVGSCEVGAHKGF